MPQASELGPDASIPVTERRKERKKIVKTEIEGFCGFVDCYIVESRCG
jgi:hypothetical protein